MEAKKTRAVEELASSAFKSMILLSMKDTKPSAVWNTTLASHEKHLDLYPYVASFDDTIFIQITWERPDEEFYIKLLALRNAILRLWLSQESASVPGPRFYLP